MKIILASILVVLAVLLYPTSSLYLADGEGWGQPYHSVVSVQGRRLLIPLKTPTRFNPAIHVPPYAFRSLVGAKLSLQFPDAITVKAPTSQAWAIDASGDITELSAWIGTVNPSEYINAREALEITADIPRSLQRSTYVGPLVYRIYYTITGLDHWPVSGVISLEAK